MRLPRSLAGEPVRFEALPALRFPAALLALRFMDFLGGVSYEVLRGMGYPQGAPVPDSPIPPGPLPNFGPGPLRVGEVDLPGLASNPGP